MANDQYIHPLLRRSKDSARMLPYWNKTDAIIEGYDAMVNAGTEYLPKFTDESKADYETRLKLAKFTNIYRDVVEGLAAKPFEKEVALANQNVPPEFEEFVENVDGSGNNLTVFAAATFFNGINSAIDWIFIDYPKVPIDSIRTMADQKAAGLKPFWSHILARNVLEVRTENVDSKEMLTYFRVYEPATDTTKERVRVFERSVENGAINWSLWERVEKPDKPENAFMLIDAGILSIKVIPFVPFATGRRDGKTFYFYPAMADAADLQITLYQDESALQFIKTMAGYPMLAGNGIKPQFEQDGKTPKKLAVGPSRVLYAGADASGNHGSWAFVEPSASSMEFLQKSIKETKQDLRELGRQPLTAQSSQMTVITTTVAAGKAKSAVGFWCLLLKDALENALKITAEWMKSDFEPTVKVYDEFDSMLDTTSDITALTTMRKERDLSQDTYWKEMQRRRVLSDEFDPEKEREALLEEIPSDGDDTNLDDVDNPEGSGNENEPQPSPAPDGGGATIG